MGEAGLTAVIRGVIVVATLAVRGITGLFDAVSEFYDYLFAADEGNVTYEAAIDNVTMALGDQTTQTAYLMDVTQNGSLVTIDQIRLARESAIAIRDKTDALIAERRTQVLGSDEYLQLLGDIRLARSNLDAMKPVSGDFEDVPAHMRDGYILAEGALISFLEKQRDMIGILNETALLTDDEQAALAASNDLLDEKEARWSDISDTMFGIVDPADRVRAIIGDYPGILGDGAGGASYLGQMIEGLATAALRLGNNIAWAVSMLPGVSQGINALGGMFDGAGGDVLSGVGNTLGATWEGVMRQVNAPKPPGASSGGGSGGSGRSSVDREMNDMLRERDKILQSLKTEQDKYNDSVAQADRLLKASVLDLDDYTSHISNLKSELEQIEFKVVLDGIDDISDGLANAIMAGGSLGDVFSNVLKQIVADILSSNIKSLLTDMLIPSGGGGGGVFGNLFGGLFAARAGGGPVSGGSPYLVNENTPNSEIFVPSQSGGILNVGQAQAALRGAGGQGGTSVIELRMGAGVKAEILQEAAGQAVKITQVGLQQYSKHAAPTIQNNISRDPRKVG